MNIFIGNLSTHIREDDIHTLFSPFGKIDSIILSKLLTFGFVKMDSAAAASNAIKTLRGSVFQGRKLIVSHARNTARFNRPTTRRLKLKK